MIRREVVIRRLLIEADADFSLSILIINPLAHCVLNSWQQLTGVSSVSYNSYVVLRLGTEKLYKTIEVDEKPVCIKNTDSKIVKGVQNSLATNATLSPDRDTCWSSMDLFGRISQNRYY